MTVEEKRSRLSDYCEMRTCDSSCPLVGAGWDHKIESTKCLEIGCATEKEIDRAISLFELEERNRKSETNAPSVDPVNRPAHYTDGKIEVIEYIEDKGLGFCLGNAIKYISRAGKKYKDKEVEDLKKAIWYIERRIKELEEGLS